MCEIIMSPELYHSSDRESFISSGDGMLFHIHTMVPMIMRWWRSHAIRVEQGDIVTTTCNLVVYCN